MPEETGLIEKPSTENSQSEKTVVDLDKKSQKSKEITISKVKFFSILAILILIILIEIPIVYSFGSASGQNSSGQIQKTATTSAQTTEPGVQTVGLNKEVTVKSGITIKLEKASYNAAYLQSQNDSKTYYQNNASQSAYLNSDYFKNSQLDLRISFNNSTKNAVSYSPSSFRLKDSQNVQYVAIYNEGGKQVYGLNPNETTVLTLSFNVPTSEKNFQLIYDNAIIEFSIK